MATLLANVISCFILGLFLVLTRDKNSYISLSPLVITGFCGGLSTFSTFSYETYQLYQQEYYTYSIINVFLSILICILSIYLGIKTGRMF